MCNICVFAGTTEGRELVEFLAGQPVQATVCVATEYGETLLPEAENVTVLAGRIPVAGIIRMLQETRFDLVIDATHPYAASITESICTACRETETEYLRLLRQSCDPKEALVCVENAAEAAAFLANTEGSILLTTGSKELAAYSGILDFTQRVYARVLPMDASLEACRTAGLKASHIIAMQGPFSEEMDLATLRFANAAWMVTKDGGEAGGFPAKVSAARKAGAGLVVIGRPPQREGLPFAAVLDVLASARRRRISALTTGFASGAGETRRRFAEMLSLRKKQRGTPLLCLLLALVVLASTLVACAAPARPDTAAPVYKGGTPQPTAGEAPEERLERLREELQTLQAEIGRLEALAAQDSSLEEIQRQYLQAQQEWAEWSAAVPEGAPSGGAAQFAWPLPGYTTLSSDFGTARRVYGAKDVHTGMDIPAPAGTPVYAAADGAASLNNHWVMGISVKLDHGGSLATLYGHLSACAVKDGDLVEKGQLIGYVGSTGNSTGNHLHFEVDLNGDPVSAWPYLNAE